MTVIINDLVTGVLNHQIFDHVENEFNIRFADADDLVKGHPLSAITDVTFDEYFARNLFKKIEDDLGLNPDQVATEAALNHVSKTIENSVKFEAVISKKPENLMKVLNKARDILHDVLGTFSIYNVQPRYTLGATEDLTRSTDVLTRIKTGSGYNTLKSKFSPLDLELLLHQLPHVEEENGIMRDHTVFACVPKTAKESRPIGYHEPYVLAVQSGIGDYLQRRLKRVGIDITTAESKHRAYAQFYSVYGDFCTMDQSNASQNILRSHCKFFLPNDLFDVISKVCPSTIIINGKTYHHEMMAAQGNGLIFPLQTLLFWALISACCWVKGYKGEILQYGDDSIFKAEAFDLVSQVFSAIGFEVNQEKSFHTGLIRESCGGDYLDGLNVRPFYVKKLPRTTSDWYHVCNGVYRVGCANNDNRWRSAFIKRFWLRCLSNIPKSERFFGPVEYGDDVLHGCGEDRYTFNRQGTKIRTLGTVYSEDGDNFGKLIQGMPGSVIFKAVVFTPFLKDSGFKLFSESYKTRLKTEESGNYPKILGSRRTKVVEKWLNYPPSVISNHDDIDHIFDRLNINHSEMIDWYDTKLHYRRSVLIDRLKRLVDLRSQAESLVQDIVL